MMVGFTVHALYAIVDTIYIGRLGADALAAAGYIGGLFFTSIALTNGLSAGITAAVARACGARDRSLQSDIASNGLSLCLCIGFLFGALCLWSGPRIIPLLGAEGESVRYAWDYMAPLFAGMPLFFATTAIRSVLNGEGDSRTPMIILLISTVVNLVLDPVFMFAMGQGIAGAAHATLVAQAVALGALLYVAFVRRRMESSFRWSRMRFRRPLLSAIVGVGLPTTAGHLVMALGMVLTNRVIAFFGQEAVAGYVAGSRVDMFVSLPIMGIAAGAMTLVGMYGGANRPDLVRATTLNAWRWAVLSALGLGVLVYAFSDAVVGFFVQEEGARAIGRQYLGYAVFAYPLMAFGMTSGRILQGLGHGMPSLVITSARVLFIGAAGAYGAVYLLDAPIAAVWISFVAGGAGAVVLSFLWVRRHLWRRSPA